MPGVSIIVNKAIKKGTVNRAFLETKFCQNIIPTELPAFLDYAEGVAKAGTGLMNVDQQWTVA